jgi:hypothetical protein
MTASGFDKAFVDEVRSRTSLVGLIGGHIPLKRSGRDFKACCPFHQERTPSFYVVESKGIWHCFGCGEGGDAIAYRRRAWREDFPTAVQQLALLAGMTVPGVIPRRDRAPLAPVVPRATDQEAVAERRADAERAGEAWRHAVPGAGTPVETYLRSRGILLPVPPSLRYCARLPYWTAGPAGRMHKVGEFPAMLGAIQNAAGGIVGLHRTYLDPDTFRKLTAVAPDGEVLVAKKMTGTLMGSAVRFARAGETLALAEGIESALSVAQACPGLPVWAALSLNNLCGSGQGIGRRRAPDDPKTLAAFERREKWPRLPPVDPDMDRPGILPPRGVREIVLLADADNKDPPNAEALLQRAVRRFQQLGLRVRIARPDDGHDFNSMLTAKGAA